MNRLKTQIHCYIDWLIERGLTTQPSTLCDTHNSLDRYIAIDKKHSPEIEEDLPLVTEEKAPANEVHSAFNIFEKDIVFIFPKMPSGSSLHLFTRMLKALEIKDGTFQILIWQNSFDPGALLESLCDKSCKTLIVLDEMISEVLFDRNFHEICFKVETGSIEFRALAAPSIDKIVLKPELKRPLWRGLLEVFNMSRH